MTWFENVDADMVFWIVIGVIVVAAIFFRYLSSISRDRTARDLAERGHPVPPEMFLRERNGGSVSRGIYMICSAIALFVFFWAMTGGFVNGVHLGPSWLPFIAVFPFASGVAMLLAALFGSRDRYH